MKKNANRQSRTRLQTLGTAQLAQVAGGVNAVEYYGAIVAVTAAMLDTLFAGR
jgi:hypothetical protein